MSISERFKIDPFYIRKQSFHEVMLLTKRIKKFDKSNNSTSNKPRRIRRKAGDNWF